MRSQFHFWHSSSKSPRYKNFLEKNLIKWVHLWRDQLSNRDNSLVQQINFSVNIDDVYAGPEGPFYALSKIDAKRRNVFQLSSVLVEFHRDKGIEWRGNSILHILYCYSLQQHIVLAFCNDFDTHSRVFAYILLRKKILLFPKWRQKPTRPILRYSSVVNMEKGKFTNFKNSYKINKNRYNDNFFAVVIRGKRKFILAEKKLGG